MSDLFLASGSGDGWRQVVELLAAFLLSSVIGLERQFRGKSAGLRTQTIVGTAAALFLVVSKYGFYDVVSGTSMVADPTRVAAQIVSGIGFLGAGLIVTRNGAVHGLTTAASVWETVAIGMSAGAGLMMPALIVTGLHFVVVLAYTPLVRVIDRRAHGELDYSVTYLDGRGVLRELLAACSSNDWTVSSLAVLSGVGVGASPGPRLDDRLAPGLVSVGLTLRGPKVAAAASALGSIEGVVRAQLRDEDDDF